MCSSFTPRGYAHVLCVDLDLPLIISLNPQPLLCVQRNTFPEICGTVNCSFNWSWVLPLRKNSTRTREKRCNFHNQETCQYDGEQLPQTQISFESHSSGPLALFFALLWVQVIPSRLFPWRGHTVSNALLSICRKWNVCPCAEPQLHSSTFCFVLSCQITAKCQHYGTYTVSVSQSPCLIWPKCSGFWGVTDNF